MTAQRRNRGVRPQASDCHKSLRHKRLNTHAGNTGQGARRPGLPGSPTETGLAALFEDKLEKPREMSTL